MSSILLAHIDVGGGGYSLLLVAVAGKSLSDSVYSL